MAECIVNCMSPGAEEHGREALGDVPAGRPGPTSLQPQAEPHAAAALPSARVSRERGTRPAKQLLIELL